jgi:hypothetical protein
MSQYMPVTATISEVVAMPAGRASQPGRPLTFSDQAAKRPRTWMRPERWPMPSTSRATVRTVAAVEARTISPTAAPPAGSVPVEAEAIMTAFDVTSNEVT